MIGSSDAQQVLRTFPWPVGVPSPVLRMHRTTEAFFVELSTSMKEEERVRVHAAGPTPEAVLRQLIASWVREHGFGEDIVKEADAQAWRRLVN